jgi:hypothetical protein
MKPQNPRPEIRVNLLVFRADKGYNLCCLLEYNLMARGQKIKKTILISFAILLTVAALAAATPTATHQAQKAVKGWLIKTRARPLGTPLGQMITRVDSFTDGKGEVIYYIVYLHPSGFVIVPADDLIEPIIGFASAGHYDPSLDNPLGALVTQDLNARVAAVR